MPIWIAAGLLLALSSLAGCGPATVKEVVWPGPAAQTLSPAPPGSPPLNYLRSLVGAEDFARESRSGKMFRWLFGASSEDLPLLTPYAVAVGDDGVVWVADSGARMLFRIDLPREQVDYLMEVQGARLSVPSGVAIDAARQRIYLSDAGSDRLSLFDLAGQAAGQWTAPGGIKRPGGVTVDRAGQVYVADVLDGTVVMFDSEGRFLGRRGSQINEDGRFNRPVSVAIGPGGELLVVDSMNFRVEVQGADGGLLGSIGAIGDAPGYFARPRGVAVDRHGRVYVSDAAFDNIQVFDLAGNLLSHFGGAGGKPGQFNLPAGIYIDSGGRLFVADSYNHRVQVLQLGEPTP